MTRKQIFTLMFSRDIIMPFVSLVFFYVSFISIKDYGLQVSDLDKYVGEFASCDSVVIKVKDKPLFKQITQRLDIRLENSPYNFTITTTDDFGYLTSRISKGGTIEIWTKTGREKIQQTNRVSINHLVYRNEILVDFNKTFAVRPNLIIISLVASFGFLIWYYFRLKRRLLKIRKA